MIELPYTLKEIIIIIAVVLFLYYAYVILRYYPNELKEFLRRKQNLRQGDHQDETEIIDPFEGYHSSFEGVRNEEEHNEDENYVLAEELILRIQETISDAIDQELDQGETLRYLSSILMEYPTIKEEVLRAGITELILSEFKKHGSVSPSRSEVDGLWKMALG